MTNDQTDHPNDDATASPRRYNAKYLILLNSDKAKRALLFAGDHRYLAEVIDDDGLMIDNLIRAGTICLPPTELALHTVVPAPVPEAANMQCFALG